MNPATLSRIYAELDAALTQAKEDGLEIVDGTFGNGVETCCAWTSLFREFEDSNALPALASNRFGISLEQFESLYGGFDASPPEYSKDADFYALGQRLRAKHLTQ